MRLRSPGDPGSVIAFRGRFDCNLTRGWGGLADCAHVLLLRRAPSSGNVTPTDYAGRRTYSSSNGVVIITRNRQHLIRTKNPHHLEHMMLLYAECSGTRARKRMTDIQPVARHIVFWTEITAEMLPHPPATPFRRSLFQPGCCCRYSLNPRRFRCSARYSPTRPRLPRIFKTVRYI
jgi:hypothetical protein